ncbi:extracellular solute-binding protein [Phytoactinopolyspora halotolerans]|uniref:Extracellular solute-binding protein n=1 Tax=Phytoactinopolyspora halotolerans TaxID=1981512 RepID=A0A6L9SCG4_9ACTN|nr:extracellular solute-binding protein [Phytoactinopolyspora halotolerans]NEE02282.1 extracellular solute-binding protein [Phytoactinopolyspora halotolerans]
MRTTRILLTGLATAALALSACGGDDGGDTDSTDEAQAAAGDDTSGDDGEDAQAPEPAEIRLWLNGGDTPDTMRDWLIEAFEEQNPGSTLVIEEQQWEGLVDRLTTSLGSASETPDVVEIGNTQAPTFTTVGAFSDLTDMLGDLGGDDLLQGFVDAGSVDGQTYAVPLYAGSKYVFYRKDLFAESGLEVPATMEEFVDAAVTLKQDNDDMQNFSGFWFPGQDWRNGVTFLWDSGGELAVQEGDEWHGALSTPESIEGLERAQQLFTEASGAPKDGNEADPQVPFCAGEVGMLSAPGWVRWSIDNEEIGCPEMMENVGVFAMPGSDGEPAPVLLGGSNIAISANSQNQELARSLVELILSDDFQAQYAENGLTPAKMSLADGLGDDEFATASIEAVTNAKLTPAAANWAVVEGSRVLEDLFVAIANGGDVEQLAADADASITEQLD